MKARASRQLHSLAASEIVFQFLIPNAQALSSKLDFHQVTHICASEPASISLELALGLIHPGS